MAIRALTSAQVLASRSGLNAKACQRLLMKAVLRVVRMSSNTAFTRGSASGFGTGAVVAMADSGSWG